MTFAPALVTPHLDLVTLVSSACRTELGFDSTALARTVGGYCC